MGYGLIAAMEFQTHNLREVRKDRMNSAQSHSLGWFWIIQAFASSLQHPIAIRPYKAMEGCLLWIDTPFPPGSWTDDTTIITRLKRPIVRARFGPVYRLSPPLDEKKPPEMRDNWSSPPWTTFHLPYLQQPQRASTVVYAHTPTALPRPSPLQFPTSPISGLNLTSKLNGTLTPTTNMSICAFSESPGQEEDEAEISATTDARSPTAISWSSLKRLSAVVALVLNLSLLCGPMRPTGNEEDSDMDLEGQGDEHEEGEGKDADMRSVPGSLSSAPTPPTRKLTHIVDPASPPSMLAALGLFWTNEGLAGPPSPPGKGPSTILSMYARKRTRETKGIRTRCFGWSKTELPLEETTAPFP
ncbi:hypothetical protein CPC08DRAFT_730912 [Agrocybe pediades]|nr:hypothetical protein CPC08DRAFT_730912 [Agrocybe pediades]